MVDIWPMEDLHLKIDASMLVHIEKYLLKTQTIRSYCLEHSIKDHVFHYWYGKYKSLQKESSVTKSFVEVALTVTSCLVEVKGSNGCSCHFTSLPPVTYLHQLLSL
jgi:hypothetical protein